LSSDSKASGFERRWLRTPAVDKPGGEFDDGQPEATARLLSSALPTSSISSPEHAHGQQ